MRRLIIEEPVSRPAKWAPTVALFGLFVTGIAALLIRSDKVDYEAAFAAFLAGLVIALTAVGLSLVAFVRIWQEGRRGLKSAIWGLIVAALVLAYPAYVAVTAIGLPPINDITTDTQDPPAFSRSQAVLTVRNGHVPPDPSPEAREMQRASYAQIAPLILDLSPEEAVGVVRRAASNLGWRVIEVVPPGGRLGVARIEAVDRTPLLRLPDDITIRIRPRAEGVRIDIRSASRFGQFDFGANAKRIRAFLVEAAALAETVP